VKGKRNPVKLVSTVNNRKIAVQASNRFPVISPYTTMNPVAIPTRLNTTCNRVKVDKVMPRIMCLSFQNRDEEPVLETVATNP
jgi:hypothetical protein